MLPGKPCRFLVDCYPLLTTTSVMLVTVLLALWATACIAESDALQQMTARKSRTEFHDNCYGQ
jgi:hypothetical protein